MKIEMTVDEVKNLNTDFRKALREAFAAFGVEKGSNVSVKKVNGTVTVEYTPGKLPK